MNAHEKQIFCKGNGNYSYTCNDNSVRGICPDIYAGMSTGKIMVGLSVGVDSAVAAFLLKEQGYDVAGATFRMQDEWDGAYDASAVAEFLGIPHYIFDFREIFKEKVLLKNLNDVDTIPPTVKNKIKLQGL